MLKINAAKKRGDAVDTNKKYFAGQNRQHKTDKNTAVLDAETEELHHERSFKLIIKFWGPYFLIL